MFVLQQYEFVFEIPRCTGPYNNGKVYKKTVCGNAHKRLWLNVV